VLARLPLHQEVRPHLVGAAVAGRAPCVGTLDPLGVEGGHVVVEVGAASNGLAARQALVGLTLVLGLDVLLEQMLGGGGVVAVLALLGLVAGVRALVVFQLLGRAVGLAAVLALVLLWVAVGDEVAVHLGLGRGVAAVGPRTLELLQVLPVDVGHHQVRQVGLVVVLPGVLGAGVDKAAGAVLTKV